MRAFRGFLDELVADPPQAVAGNLVPELAVCGSGLRVTRQRRGGGKHGERKLALLERAQHAPQPGP